MEIYINKLTPELIGQIVTVQVFPIDTSEPGLIHSDHLVKDVGILEGYTFDNDRKSVHIYFKLGVVPIYTESSYYEIYSKLTS